MAIDWNKPIRWASNKKPLTLMGELGGCKCVAWEGTFGPQSLMVAWHAPGIENVPERREWWANVFRGEVGGPEIMCWGSIEDAFSEGAKRDEFWHIIEDGDTVTVTKVKA